MIYRLHKVVAVPEYPRCGVALPLALIPVAHLKDLFILFSHIGLQSLQTAGKAHP